MDIHVDGYRSTNENWLLAQNVASQELPPLTQEQREVAKDLGLSPDAYARSLFAGDLTRGELQQRSEAVAHLVNRWLERNAVRGDVKAIWLKTFEGKFRVDVQNAGRTVLVFIDEDVIDGILASGSSESQRQFERILDANFGMKEQARAS